MRVYMLQTNIFRQKFVNRSSAFQNRSTLAAKDRQKHDTIYCNH